jgi:hypothetical protein
METQMSNPNCDKVSKQPTKSRKKNALAHEIYGKDICLPWKSRKDFEKLLADLRDDFRPVGRMQNDPDRVVVGCGQGGENRGPPMTRDGDSLTRLVSVSAGGDFLCLDGADGFGGAIAHCGRAARLQGRSRISTPALGRSSRKAIGHGRE